MRPSRVGLALVLVAAAVLRFWDLGHGIPHAIGSEEPEIVRRAFYMMDAGTYNPRFHDYGQLHLSLQLGVSILRFMKGAMDGEWYSLAQATSESFYVWGRALVAAFGVATVWLVFHAGMRWGARHALLAAAILAVSPLHVQYSQLAVPDVLLTFCVALVMLLTLIAAEKRTLAAFLWAAGAVGLAAGCRYSGALTIVMPLAACWMAPAVRPNRVAATAGILVAANIGFLVAAPFTVVNPPAFLDRFAQLAAAARQSAPADGGILLPLQALVAQFAWPSASGPVPAAGWPAVAMIVAGCVMALVRAVRGPGHARWAAVAAFILVEAAALGWRPSGQARDILPLLPVLSVLGAAAVISGVSLLRRFDFPRWARSGLIALLTLIILAPGAASAIQHNAHRSRTTTQDLAYEWMKQHLRRESVVAVEGGVLVVPRTVAAARPVGELRDKTAEAYAREGVHYLIASSATYGRYLSQPRAYRREYLAYTRLFSETREVARFSPSRSTPGPEVRILKVGP